MVLEGDSVDLEVIGRLRIAIELVCGIRNAVLASN